MPPGPAVADAARNYDVLVLGGGHAGVRAARQITRRRGPGESLSVALVNRDNVELWHGLMPQTLTNVVKPQHVVVPLRESLPGVHVYRNEIREIDLDQHRVTVDSGLDTEEIALAYRYLVLAVGSVPNVSQVPGMADHALATRTIADFVHLRNHVIAMLEAASESPDPQLRSEQLTFVVAGAGFAGVEVCAGIEELITAALPLYPTLRRSDVRILCVDPLSRVLPSLSERTSAMALRHLRRRGIEVRVGQKIESAWLHGVRLSDGDTIHTRSLVATAGTAPNPILSGLAVELVHGRVRCDEYGRVAGRPDLFAAGDAAAIPDHNGNPYPPTVTFAVAGGAAVGANLVAQSRARPLRRCDFSSVTQVGILSRRYGVAQLRGRAIGGRPAVFLGRLHFVGYLPSWRRRFGLMLDWLTAGLSVRDIAQVEVSGSQAVVTMRFMPGDEIVREGELGNRFFFIQEGEVLVLQHGNGEPRQIRRLGPGSFFGERALTGGIRRTASVRALVETRVIALNRHDFRILADYIPALQAQLNAAPYAAADPE